VECKQRGRGRGRGGAAGTGAEDNYVYRVDARAEPDVISLREPSVRDP